MKRRKGNNYWSAHQRPGTGEIKEYNGRLLVTGCWIVDEAHIVDLWFRGCYGKGVLSRSKPERLQRGKSIHRLVSEENPFHGQGPVVPLAPLLGVPQEPLHLSPQETCYLMHVEKVLRLEGEDQVVFTTQGVWDHFVGVQPRFAALYVVYHHYRRLGYVVRPGGKFGGDFVLYEDQPEKYHAKFSVSVQDVVAEPNMSWPQLLGMGRVSENAVKSLLWCRVRLGQGEGIDQVVSTSKLEELLYERWSPHTTRDADDD